MKIHYFTIVTCLGMLAIGCRSTRPRDQALDAFNMVDALLPTGRVVNGYTPKDTLPTAKQLATNDTDNVKFALRVSFYEYKSARAAGDVIKARNIRDRIAESMITMIKHYHEGTSDDLYELTGSLESFFDFAGLTLGGLGAVTGGTAAKSAYSAAAAGLIGAKASLGKNILAEQTKFAILQQMQALRVEKEASILRRLKNDDDSGYPLEAVVSDLYDYLNAGSVKQSVAALVKAAQEANTAAEANKAKAEAALTIRPPNYASAELGRLVAESKSAAGRAVSLGSLATNETVKAQLTSIGSNLIELSSTINSKVTVPGELVESQNKLRDAQQKLNDAETKLKTSANNSSQQNEIESLKQDVASKKQTLSDAETSLNVVEKAYNELLVLIDFWNTQLKQYQARLDELKVNSIGAKEE